MEIMIKRPDVSGLVTTISLTAAETKTPIVNDIYIYIYTKRKNMQIPLTHYNKFTKDILDAKIKKDNLVNEFSLNEKIKTSTKEKTKNQQ